MNVARPLKGKGIADSGGKDVVLGIVLKLFREFDLCSLAVFEFVRSTGGGSDKIARAQGAPIVPSATRLRVLHFTLRRFLCSKQI